MVCVLCATKNMFLYHRPWSYFPELSSRKCVAFPFTFDLKKFFGILFCICMRWGWVKFSSHKDTPLLWQIAFLTTLVHSFSNVKRVDYQFSSTHLFSIFVPASHCPDWCSCILHLLSGRTSVLILYISFKILAFPSP